MKRLIVCCDGTWQDLNTAFPTNVVKMCQAIQPVANDGCRQSIFYGRGLGTRPRDRLPGGALGRGIDLEIQDAYLFLCLNYEPGDELYLFGYSRGAYTVRSVIGLINCSGLLKRHNTRKLQQAYKIYRDPEIKPSHPIAQAFRAENGNRVSITLLGCWDTVGSLGIPDLVPWLPLNNWINRQYQFHNTTLSRIIQRALHAVAIDERRRVFDLTPMEQNPEHTGQLLRQVWFPGNHGCVGGGAAATQELSNATFLWMIQQISQLGLGLGLDTSPVEAGVDVDHRCDFQNKTGLFGALGGTIWRQIPAKSFKLLHESAQWRWCDRSDYRPANLRQYEANLDAQCQNGLRRLNENARN
ncbi:DUF2235 domain-containing protein [Synechococcales cyanobacterium C]|uniref:DUF2235 domain-containing protein n=1 Tax=Petrachloros mirabilis ULC683 TaxID=2781853 RepID=A0A8K1ZYL6_9CYAN|nr:DUF2235 domain-containing protein [Petrachloros mirabilis]NCJ06386.1 DUF2235 domain-containing protein [Petrachloros mirabilis ULC683]